MRRLLTCIGVLALVAGCSIAPSKPDQITQDDTTYLDAYLDWALEEERRRNDIASMTVIVVDKDQTLATHYSGDGDREASVEANPQTQYRIGSVTKLFTALSILQLVDAGNVELDAPIQQYLPTLKMNTDHTADAVTIRKVLSHHSGLPSDMWAGFADNQAINSLIPQLNGQVLSYTPGEVFSYSNVGYALLGLVIEKVSGQTYAEYVTDHIFTPLVLNNSSVGAKHPNLAKPYERLNIMDYPQIRDTAAGDIAMSASDLARFAQVMLNNGRYTDDNGNIQQLLSDASFEQMVTPQNANSPLYADLPMGLSWFLYYPRPTLMDSDEIRWHGGATHYFHSSLITLPDTGVAVVVLANSAEAYESVSTIAEQTTRLAYEVKTGKPWPAANHLNNTESHPNNTSGKTKHPLSQAKKTALTGHYLSPALGAIEVIEKTNGELLAQNTDGKVVLIPYQDGTFGAEYRALDAFAFDNAFFQELRLFPITYQGKQLIKEKNGGIVAEKIEPKHLSAKWQKRLGHYVHDNPDDLYQFSEVSLTNHKGYLKLSTVNEASDQPQDLYFDIITHDRAINVGYGRGSGDSLLVTAHADGTTTLSYLGMTFTQAR